MIDLINHGCKLHPDVMMAFDEVKKQWFCKKCADAAAAFDREMARPTGSLSTSKTSSANSFTDPGPGESDDGLAEKAARMKIEELNFLEFIKAQEEKESKKSIKLDQENGWYFGPVIYADTSHAVQRSGPLVFVIHAQLDPPLTKDDEVIEIKYKDGLGVVVPAKHVGKSLGR